MSERRTGGRDAELEERPLNVLSYERGRLRQALPKVVGRCMSFSAMTCFDPSLVAAVFRFYGLEVDVATAETEILEDESERVRFFPWFLWDWRPDDEPDTVGERFMRESDLSDWEIRLAEGLCRSYVGFYEVLGREGVTVHLLDLATQEVLLVPDEALAADVADNQIVQARLVRFGGADDAVAMVDAVYAALPPEARAAVKLELESVLGEAPRRDLLLKSFAPELLDFADHLIDSLGQPPVAENTDGESLSLVLGAVRGAGASALLAALDARPEGVVELEPGLHVVRDVERTLGFIDARDPQRLWLGANSLARHEALDGWAAAVSGGAARCGLKSVEDFGRAVQRWAERGGGGLWLTADAEVRAAVGDWFAAWARHWADMPLAALGERTPREAVRDAAGRTLVEKMLARFEDLLLGELSALRSVSLDGLRHELGVGAP